MSTKLTVKQLKDSLEEFDDGMEIRFATRPDEGLVLLSVYKGDKGNTLWIDVSLDGAQNQALFR